MTDLDVLEKKIEVSFRKKALLVEAMTHRSYLQTDPAAAMSHNGRLEYLGSYVLGLAVRESLLRVLPKHEAGDISPVANAFISAKMLADVAKELGLFAFLSIRRGSADEQSGTMGTYKALVGAIHADQGYVAARSFITRTLLIPRLKLLEENLSRDSKTLLQETAQHLFSALPNYKMLSEKGPGNSRIFEVGVFIRGRMVAKGEGHSKKEAEMAAAGNALQEQGWRV